MQTIPNSTLYLCNNVDLDPNYNYTIDFDNITAQANYFDSRIASVFEINEGYSYIRDSQSLKVQANIDDLLGINYLFYNNGNKRYYAFITKKEYINPTCTSLSFKLDVLQSFMFNYEIDESFIEREHQDRFIKLSNNSLLPAFNTILENLDIGRNYEVKTTTQIENDTRTAGRENVNIMWYIIIAKANLHNNDTGTTYINGIRTGYYIYFRPEVINNTNNYYFTFNNFQLSDSIDAICKDSKVVAVVLTRYTPFSVRYAFLDNNRIELILSSNEWEGLTWGYGGIGANKLKVSNDRIFYDKPKYSGTLSLSINNLKNIEYETKLLTYPYNKIVIRANNDKQEYSRENFTNTIKFKFGIDYSLINKMIIKPVDYLGNNIDDVLISASSNEMTLLTNAWQDYELQNKASLRTGILSGVAQAGAGLALGAITGGVGLAVAGSAVISTAGGIANELIKRQDIKETPDTLRKSMGSAVVDDNIKGLYLQVEEHQIKDVYRNIIFNYFYHYGYKCNDFKKPNTRSRYYFNYIKTIGANIKTNIDADFRAEIENAYNNGITIWHYRNATTFKGVNNYDYENVELNLMED